MLNQATAPPLIHSLQCGLKIIEAISENGPLKSICALIGIVLPTAYHLLRALIHEDYVCRLAGQPVRPWAAIDLHVPAGVSRADAPRGG